MLSLYIWRKCGTCRDATRFLKKLGISVNERDFFERPFSEDEILEISSYDSLECIFSWRSPSAMPYRERKSSMTKDEMVALMMQEPRLIRRPMLITPSNDLIIGFDKKRYSLLAE